VIPYEGCSREGEAVILDIFCEIQRANPEWSREAEQQLIFDSLEQAKAADEAGYDTWWQVEHHGAMEFSLSSSPELFLSMVAQNTSRMRVGHAGVLSPFGINHPLKVAERAAYMDIMSNGRLELGLARSSGSEWENFSVDGDLTRQQTTELFRMLPQMWNDTSFSWKSDMISIPNINVVPKPLQQPHPALWLTGTSPDAFKMAGELGVGGIATTMLWPVAPIAGLVEVYRQAVANCTQPAGKFVNNKFGCFTFVHCTETRDQAIESRAAEAALWYVNNAPVIFRVPRPALMTAVRGVQPDEDQSFRQYTGGFVEGEVDPDDPMPIIRMLNRQYLGMELDPEEVYDVVSGIDSCVIGDEETCLGKMQKFADAGVDRLLCLQQFGGLSQEQSMASIRRVGENLRSRIVALAS
jgi:alkanesulfonate monooxygenase SsuD/methylene tetrahydromethanopterin reductase-like flavin-dependent oxidoreductase (luciferase family)